MEVDQNISTYVGSVDEHYLATLDDYLKDYFKPWNLNSIDISRKDAMWAYRSFSVKNSYGENLQPLDDSFFEDIYNRSNFRAFATVNEPAITLHALNIRAFPTDKPLLMDPSKAGEGFPFDYLQNSTIAANKPLLISHYSRDGEWVFVEASFAYGWVKSRDIVKIPKEYTQRYQKAKQMFFIKESVPVYDSFHNFLFRSKIGMMLPVIEEGEKSATLLTISNYKNSIALYNKSSIAREYLHEGILPFSAANIVKIFHEVAHVKYGWGGMYGDRDCSSTLRDFYAPFGIWLPRNSYAQSKIGRVISLKGLSKREKLQKITEEGIPFETLLYKRGHILLYVGIKDGKVIVFHNTWGIKTKKDQKEGRFIIGRPVFSTLEFGRGVKDYDEESSLLSHLQSMNIVTAY